jgi:hypothetical protein
VVRERARGQVDGGECGSVADAHAAAAMSNATSSSAAGIPARPAHSDRPRGPRRPGGHGHDQVYQAAYGEDGQAPESQRVGYGSHLPTRHCENAAGQTMRPASIQGVPKAFPEPCRERARAVSGTTIQSSGLCPRDRSRQTSTFDR